MKPSWQQEIQKLHRFFEGWLSGALPPTDATFTRLERALDETFTFISPAGRRLDREGILAMVRAGHGGRPDLKIWIEKPCLRLRHGELTVATYEEWQEASGVRTARLSTVIFADRPGDAHELAWLHVQETWLEPDDG